MSAATRKTLHSIPLSAVVYERLGRYEEAIVHHEASLISFRELGDRRAEAEAGWHVAIELAVTHTALGDGDQELSALDWADNLAVALRDESSSALITHSREDISDHWRGHCLTKLGYTKEARQALERDARSIPANITTARAAGAQVMNLADVEAQDGAIDAAAHLLTQAWPVARETRSLKAQAHIREVRAKLPSPSASRAVRELDEVLTST